jgi:hypothetical protein
MSSVVSCRFAMFRAFTFAFLTGAPVVVYAACPGQVPTADTMGLDCNAQQQQEEQRRQNEWLEQQRQQQQQQADQEYYDAMQRDAMQRQQGTAAQGQQVRQAWESRPPLPPSQNPLLGRWNSLGAPGSGPPDPNGPDDFAALANALIGGMVSGLCDSMLSQGLIEFRPTSVVALGPDGSARLLYHASYRGGGSRVVVLPQDSPDFTHMIIDFDQPGHGVVAGVGCVVTRASERTAATGASGVKSAGQPASVTTSGGSPTSPASRPATMTSPGGGGGGAVLDLTAGTTMQGQFQPLANRKIWVMKGSADMALIDGGFTQTPYGSIMHHFMTACRQKTPECQKGLAAIEAKTAGSARTDATGRARTGALPPGRYYVFATLVVEDKPMVWQEPIDLHPGSNSLALDLNNAYPVE